MKKLLISILLLYISSFLFAVERTWTPVSKEQAEYNHLMEQCDQIAQYFAYIGALNSSSYPGAIFKYLKDIGTPTSLRVLEAQVKAGRIPASWLEKI
jgi:hypothetical protein